MKRTALLLSCFISLSILQGQMDSLSVKNVQEMIGSMYQKDQELRKSMGVAGEQGSSDYEALRSTVAQMDQMHNIILHRIVDEAGFPGASWFGMECTHQFWVLVMHQDTDQDFQKSVLDWMTIVLPECEVVDRDVAMLTDRVAVNSGLCQTYGTQFKYDEAADKNVPYEICHLRKMKKLRKRMRLKPFSQQVEEENSK